MKKYCIITYGCQMNVHESEKLAGMLVDRGYEKTLIETEADVIVFNTCCIRENAVQRAYGNIGALKKYKMQNKDVVLAVGGCMTQADGASETLKKKFPFIDIIFGTHNLNDFGSLFDQFLKTKKRSVSILDAPINFEECKTMAREGFPNAWVNITYGCNNFCTYCIVPYVRGRERSRCEGEIIEEVKNLLNQGYTEITLLGQNVNSYGNDLSDGSNFATLLKKLSNLGGKYRILFMTSHPKDLSDDVIDVIAENDNICKYIHLPIQSGSTPILKAMNRKYTAEHYLNLISRIRKKIPSCGISTDIMVGFPGETEEDFEATLNLVKEVQFQSAFMFVYSPRPMTIAAKDPNQVPDAVKTDRIKRLVELQNEISRSVSHQLIGKTVEVLCEDYQNETWIGRTETGKVIHFHSDRDLLGKFVFVKVLETSSATLFGDVVEV